MPIKFAIKAIAIIPGLFLFTLSCTTGKKKEQQEAFQYNKFKDSIIIVNKEATPDSSNLFDERVYTPGIDSLENILVKIDTLWHRDAAMMEQVDTLIKRLKNARNISPGEYQQLKENVRTLDTFLAKKIDTIKTSCREKECPVYAAVNKSRQLLFLYIDGELKDSFPVSTGVKKYRTPDLNVRPSGPFFTKYTSRKFPGGNYKGLGNMPYAVFLHGGYAIHGTTPGNFPKLGTIASHGCIRLHPDNARIFYELVKLFGLNNTWVTVRDSL